MLYLANYSGEELIYQKQIQGINYKLLIKVSDPDCAAPIKSLCVACSANYFICCMFLWLE